MEEDVITSGREWRVIPDYPKYEVSNDGLVRAINSHNSGQPRLLVQRLTETGYYAIPLSQEDGKRRWNFVHRLVAIAFIPNPDNLPLVHHKDETPTHNHVENLEWCSYKDNFYFGTCPQRQSEGLRRSHAIRSGRITETQAIAGMPERKLYVPLSPYKEEELANDWRTIPGYSPNYEVNSIGQVRVVNYNNSGRPRILKQRLNKEGYCRVGIADESGVRKGCFAHRLVALAFIPNPDNLPVVNHKDENPRNNCVDNLEWCTVKYNCNYGTGIARQREAQKIAFARPEHAKRMLEISKARYRDPEYRKRFSIARKQWYANLPQKRKDELRLNRIGQKRSAESKQKMADAQLRRWALEGGDGSMAHALKKASLAKQRPVLCVSTGVEYPSIKEAAAASGILAKLISACCSYNTRPSRRMHKTRGLIWIYADRKGEHQ